MALSLVDKIISFVLDTLSGSFHDPHYSLSILFFAISVHQFFPDSGKSIVIIASSPGQLRLLY